MNKQLILMLCLGCGLLFNLASAQNSSPKNKPAAAQSKPAAATDQPKPAKSHLQLSKNSIDFGTIPIGQKKVVEVTFTNTGSKPLIITDTYTNCGCTGIEFPQQPFMPGKSGTLKISYDADEEGFFSKSVTIYSNADNKKEIIKIQGIVSKND
ncbi:MAG: DUF1573 domain-containing protein [Bacteroidales bacterium]|nr:DUF1573 domain-containing protein [Bacteroidales bacterium]